jgi:MarR family transcriptional regulator, 2-MHQ and catechol-resistance regulon repressor
VQAEQREKFYGDAILDLAYSQPGDVDYPSVELALNLALTYNEQNSFLAKYMSQFGLAKSTFNVLMLLRNGPPEGMQLSEIGNLLITSRANITGLIDHLEQKGFVKRIADSHDRRAKLARITKKGEVLIDDVLPVHIRRCKELFAHLTMEEKRTLSTLLKRVRQSPALTQYGALPEAELVPAMMNED